VVELLYDLFSTKLVYPVIEEIQLSSAEDSAKVEKLNSKYIVSHQCQMKCRFLACVLLH